MIGIRRVARSERVRPLLDVVENSSLVRNPGSRYPSFLAMEDVTEVENRMMDLILDHVTYYVVPSYWSCHGKSYHGILRLLALRFDRQSLVS